jgi:hypothetical protein
MEGEKSKRRGELKENKVDNEREIKKERKRERGKGREKESKWENDK